MSEDCIAPSYIWRILLRLDLRERVSDKSESVAEYMYKATDRKFLTVLKWIYFLSFLPFYNNISNIWIAPPIPASSPTGQYMMGGNGTDMPTSLALLTCYFAYNNTTLIIEVSFLQNMSKLSLFRTAKVWLYDKLTDSGQRPHKFTKQHFSHWWSSKIRFLLLVTKYLLSSSLLLL